MSVSDISHDGGEKSGPNRRDLLKSVGAVGVAAGVGTAGATGTAAAQDDLNDYGPTDSTVANLAVLTVSPAIAATYATAVVVEGLISSSDTLDRLNLHRSAVQEAEAWAGHSVQMNNRLEDASTIASIEARDGIAKTYENGGNESEALTNLIERIRKFYSEAPEHNIIELANKALLSFHAINQDGQETDPEFSVVAAWQATGSTDTGQIYVNRDPDDLVEDATVTRHDGAEHEIGRGVAEADDNDFDGPTTVVCEVWDDNYYADGASKIGEFTPMSDEVIDAYDSDAEEFVIDVDGTEISTTLSFAIPAVTPIEDTGASAQGVYDHRDLVEFLDEIQSQSDTVVGNYDETFIGELYSLMDDGTLDPNDIRGSEGMARFLSGTDDASDSRFQLALMQQLGVGRSDLSNVASMTVNYTGAVDRRIETDDETGDRSIYTGERVENETLEGQLFADLNVEKVETGEKYVVSPTVYAADEPNGLKALDAGDGSRQWTYDGGGDPRGIAADPTRPVIYYAGAHGLTALDTDDGSDLWTNFGSSSSYVMDVDVSPDGETVYVVHDSQVKAIDPESGAEQWAVAPGSNSPDVVSTSPDGSLVVVVDGQGNAHAIDPDDGTQQWSYEQSTGGSNEVEVDPDKGLVFVSTTDNEVHAIDLEDQSQSWVYDLPSNGNGLVSSPTDETVFAGTDGELHAINTTDGTTRWTHEQSTAEYVEEIDILPGGETLYVSTDGETYALSASDGSVLWTHDGFGDDVEGLAVAPSPSGAVGTAHSATFFDPTGNDGEGEEHTLTGGVIEIEEITDADGNELEESDYGEPEYDTYDSEEYAEYIEKHTTYTETIREESEVQLPPWLQDPIGALDGLGKFLLIGGAGLLGIKILSDRDN